MEYKLQYKCVKFTNEMGSALFWGFSNYKNPKNKRGLTSLHLATFLSAFYNCQNQQSCEVELVHGLTAIPFAAFLSELVILTFL